MTRSITQGARNPRSFNSGGKDGIPIRLEGLRKQIASSRGVEKIRLALQIKQIEKLQGPQS